MTVGPIYGVELLDSLPLDGGMRQALPSAEDLVQVRNVSERTVAGYEVLLEHYQRLREALLACRKYADAAMADDPNDGLALVVEKIVSGRMGPLRTDDKSASRGMDR